MGFLDWLFGKKPAPKKQSVSGTRPPASTPRLTGITQAQKSRLPAKAAPHLSSNDRAREVLKQWMAEKEDE